VGPAAVVRFSAITWVSHLFLSRCGEFVAAGMADVVFRDDWRRNCEGFEGVD
jgi:hypothetical protein